MVGQIYRHHHDDQLKAMLHNHHSNNENKPHIHSNHTFTTIPPLPNHEQRHDHHPSTPQSQQTQTRQRQRPTSDNRTRNRVEVSLMDADGRANDIDSIRDETDHERATAVESGLGRPEQAGEREVATAEEAREDRGRGRQRQREYLRRQARDREGADPD